MKSKDYELLVTNVTEDGKYTWGQMFDDYDVRYYFRRTSELPGGWNLFVHKEDKNAAIKLITNLGEDYYDFTGKTNYLGSSRD
jgi:hypothetical protein